MNAPRTIESLVLAHDPPHIDRFDSTFVALTPVAFEEITASGRTPLVLDDLAVRPSFFLQPTDYYRWKHAWLGRLDAATRNGDRVVLAAAQLLSQPVDSVVARAALVRSAVEQAAPSSLRYSGPPPVSVAPIWHAGHLQFHPMLGDPPLVSSLAPLIASTLELPYRADHSSPPVIPNGPSFAERVRDTLATELGPLRGHQPQRRAQRDQATLMLWRTGYGAAGYAAGEMADGRAVYYLTRGGRSTRVFEPDRLSFAMVSRSASVAPRPWSTSSLDSTLLALLDEVDEWTTVPGAGRILETRLAAFVDGVCPAIDETAVALDPILRPRKVNRVVATNPSSIEEFGALEWARRHDVERVLCQHGDHLFSYDAWVFTETQNFDVLRTSDSTLQDELPALGRQYDVEVPQVVSGAPRVAELCARGTTAADSSRIAYVPAMLVGDSYVVGAGYIDDVWYHRWHRRVLDLMAARRDTSFVWKALPIADQAIDPMPDLVARVANVAYRTDPFLNVADEVGRVVTDFASTVLYECVALGIPVLALNFDRFARLRPAATEVFGHLVVECAEESDAVAAIERFLDDDPSRWVLDHDRVMRLTGCA